MAEPFLGEIRLVSFNFAPKGWAECNGQLLSISQNTALFSLLGTQFGGNGTSNFALPDARGRTFLGQGQGSGLTLYSVGEFAGAEAVTLTAGQIPAHTHAFHVSNLTATTTDPTQGSYRIPNVTPRQQILYAATTDAQAGPMVQANSGGQAHENRQPFVAMLYCIAMVGIFPSRT